VQSNPTGPVQVETPASPRGQSPPAQQSALDRHVGGDSETVNGWHTHTPTPPSKLHVSLVQSSENWQAPPSGFRQRPSLHTVLPVESPVELVVVAEDVDPRALEVVVCAMLAVVMPDVAPVLAPVVRLLVPPALAFVAVVLLAVDASVSSAAVFPQPTASKASQNVTSAGLRSLIRRTLASARHGGKRRLCR